VNSEYLYIERDYTQSQLKQLLAAQSSQHPPALPAYMQRDNMFPYTTGYNFVHKLYDVGGVKRVNEAFLRPPTSSYEIMHPTAYLHGWKPADVPLHSVSGLTGWVQTDDDVMGALGYELTLWQDVSKRTADKVVDGYRGDRYVYLTNGKQGEMLLKSRWTTPAAAALAESTWVTSLQRRWHHARIHRASGATVVTDANGSVYLRAEATALTVAYAHTSIQARQLGTATTT
jgi:hypothetical protein